MESSNRFSSDPFALLNSAFSHITEKNQISTWFSDDEKQIEEKINELSHDVLKILQHPEKHKIDPREVLRLKDRITDLRKSPMGRKNYAHCERAMHRVENAVERYGDRIKIGPKTINSVYKNDAQTQDLIAGFIHLLQNDDNQKIPLSSLYNILNENIVKDNKTRGTLLAILSKSDDKIGHLKLISKYILTPDAHDAESCQMLLEVLNQEEDGGFNLLRNAGSVFENYKLTGSVNDMMGFSKELVDAYALKNPAQMARLKTLSFAIDFTTRNLGEKAMNPLDIRPQFGVCPNPSLNKLFILNTMSLILKDKNNEIVNKNVLNKLFSTKYSYSNLHRSQNKLLNAIKVISTDKRLQSLNDLAPFLSSDMSLEEKIISLQMISKIPEEKRSLVYENVFRLTSGRSLSPDIIFKLIAFTSTFLKDDIKEVIDLSIELLNLKKSSFFKNTWLNLHGENFIQNAKENEIFSILEGIKRVPKDKRDTLVPFALKLYNSYFEKGGRDVDLSDILHGLSSLPEKEMDYFLKTPPAMNAYFPFQTSLPFTEFCLLPFELKMQILKNEETEGRSLLITEKEYKQIILKCFQDRIADFQNIAPEALLPIAMFIYTEHKNLQLFEEHPLMQKVFEIFAIHGMEGEKNPFGIYKSHKDLAKQPSSFEPVSQVIEEKSVCLNMKTLEAMSSGARIERSELPKVSRKSWDTLRFSMKDRFKQNQAEFENELKKMNSGYSWAMIEHPAFNEDAILGGLLDLSEGEVTEIEAKWKAVFNFIQQKNNAHAKGQFFSEQEKQFIISMSQIQHCEIGVKGGVEDNYQLLPEEFQYKIKLSKPRTDEKLLEDTNISNSINKLNEFIKKNSGLSFQEKIDRLVEESNIDTKNGSALLTPLLGFDNLKYWDIVTQDEDCKDNPMDDPDAEWRLKPEGAKAALHMALGTKEEARKVIVPILHQYMQNVFVRRGDDIIKDIIKNEHIKQQVHQILYLKNRIGHLFGLANTIMFDEYTGVLYEELIQLNRDKLLEVACKHITPKIVEELVRVINQSPNLKEKASKITQEKEFSSKEALELLLAAEFFKEKPLETL